jgi:hypothetical protein
VTMKNRNLLLKSDTLWRWKTEICYWIVILCDDEKQKSVIEECYFVTMKNTTLLLKSATMWR